MNLNTSIMITQEAMVSKLSQSVETHGDKLEPPIHPRQRPPRRPRPAARAPPPPPPSDAALDAEADGAARRPGALPALAAAPPLYCSSAIKVGNPSTILRLRRAAP